MINQLASDLTAESRRRLAKLDPADSRAVRRARNPVVGFSPAMGEANDAIKEFLRARMYRHWRVNRMSAKARRVTEHLFSLLVEDVSTLPDEWRGRAGEADPRRAALTVADYIAGMTDRSAVEEHRRLTDLSVPG